MDEEEEREREESSSKEEWLNVERCSYRGEGNANIVVAFSRERCVLRLRKWSLEEGRPEVGRRWAEREYRFAKHVATFFLGDYAKVPEIRQYSKRSVEELSRRIFPSRPERRRHQRIIEEFATVYPDYCLLPHQVERACVQNSPAFCVEIKPKQGYHNAEAQRLQKCSYCLTQYYKLRVAAIQSRSQYCPLDLFSGRRNRICRALEALLKNPQNNLKIFKDGNVVYDHNSHVDLARAVLKDWFGFDEHGKNIDRFCNVVCDALLRNYHENDLDEWNSADIAYSSTAKESANVIFRTNEPCDFGEPQLPENSILERILRMQKLCYVPAEIVNDIYGKYSTIIDNDMVYFGLNKFHKTPDTRELLEQTFPVPNEFLLLLQNYFLYCTARDCSILVTFKETQLHDSISNKNAVIISDDKYFLSNVNVADLDPKNVHKIKKHQERDANVLRCASDELAVEATERK
ncbi:inositol-pentakisphosphate 2-kinase [Prorops nasuta]|uniref:inositol-pentakisphosphate 2-kinase n=1 Tax=Prorops nasuta TaxID=863751 RepID=UPI0034CE7EED